jgi:hypothetical protein
VELVFQRLEGLQQGLHQLADFPGFLPEMLRGSVGGLVANPPDENPAQQEPSHYSDTTASAPASDDEGGNGVLRSPQPDQEGAGSLPASESGGSEVQVRKTGPLFLLWSLVKFYLF